MSHTDALAHRANWGGVLAMTLCIFALIASEFMPVSLLTPLAADLDVSEGLAGYGIAISGVFAVLTSLSISRLAGSVNRRKLLLTLTALMAVSGLVVALAQNYPVYMTGRALIGVVIGGFWSLSAATAMRLVPEAEVPRALAIFNSGNALATVVAAPLGSYLGSMIGWRGAFLCLLPVAAVALAWQWVCLPSMEAEEGRSHSGVVVLLRRRVVALGMMACAAFFMGQFALFTYVRPFLERVTHAGVPAVPWVLLAIGVSGFVGTLAIGAFIRRGLYRTLVIVPALMALIAVTLVPLGPHLWPTAALLSAWGLLATSAPVGWWSWLARTFTDNAEAGGGLMVAVVQCSIALGATLGGLLFDSLGFASTFLASAGILLLAALLAYATAADDVHTSAAGIATQAPKR
ncbi:MFS transporter [Stenotrophomonas sp. GD03958]|uniref:MFS transporter n=1 Tax=Stenotrophomonas sp. GD03958 TaxID=2975411 RepID=UPI0020366F80|nr:MFS transporter [Stenotrophomonas sp. GD03958]MCM2523208.1 MFS transporter [Stenotrophomonas maltophilia]MDH1193077.1 MFS transporter [Stenotrophomonas sp. GD03958]